MRLTCFLLCWLTFSAVASVNAQQGKVSIDIKSESLSRVLMQVKDQTGARILYNENLLRDVECRVQREPVAGCGVPGFEVGGGVLFDTPSCLF